MTLNIITNTNAPGDDMVEVQFEGYKCKTTRGTVRLEMPVVPVDGERGFLITGEHDDGWERSIYLSRDAMNALASMYCFDFSDEDKHYEKLSCES